MFKFNSEIQFSNCFLVLFTKKLQFHKTKKCQDIWLIENYLIWIKQTKIKLDIEITVFRSSIIVENFFSTVKNVHFFKIPQLFLLFIHFFIFLVIYKPYLQFYFVYFLSIFPFIVLLFFVCLFFTFVFMGKKDLVRQGFNDNSPTPILFV